MTEILVDLIRRDAANLADKSGKTDLDNWIETHLSDADQVSEELLPVIYELDEHDWKQWRALRQIVRRLRIESPSLSNRLALFTERSRPAEARARYYAYLTRAELGASAAMDELLEDNDLRSGRPFDWLDLAYSEATPNALHSYYMQAASKLKANEFIFSLDKLRKKFGEKFVDNMAALCLAMPFEEAYELAKMVDDDYGCGLQPTILSSHPSLHPDVHPFEACSSASKIIPIFQTLNDDMKQRLGQR